MQLSRIDRAGAKSGDVWRYYFLSDLHIGNVACHKKLIAKVVKQIAEHPNSRVFLLGDILDAIATKDKRHQESTVDPDIQRASRDDTINLQIEQAIELLSPLKGLVDCCLIGNHEESILRAASVDPLRIVAEKLDAPYQGAYTAYIRVMHRQGKNTWVADFHLHHGSGGGQMSGAKLNRIERRAGWVTSADVLASGHVHKRLYSTYSSLRVPVSMDDKLDVVEHVQHILLTGSFLRGYHTDVRGSLYTERADYCPSDLGAVWMDVQLNAIHGGPRVISYRGGMT